MSIRIAGKELRGHGTIPFLKKEVETRKVHDFVRLEDLPAKVRKDLTPAEQAAFVAAGDRGIATSTTMGLELLKKAMSHNNMDEVLFRVDKDLYIASSAQLHRKWGLGIGKSGDQVEWDGRKGEVVFVDNEKDRGRLLMLGALVATGVGIGGAVGLGAMLPAAVPVKVLGGTASVVVKSASSPGWLMALKGALPWAGAATGGIGAALGAMVGWFRRDPSGVNAVSERV